MALEIELKLEVAPEAAAFIEASPLLAGSMTRENLRALYFDTPGHHLAENGISLRIRRSGRKRIQTIKSSQGAGGGLLERGEWEVPVKNDVPVLDNQSLVHLVLGDEVSELSPIFSVDIERRSWVVTQGNATIELVIDRGFARVAERQTPICEVELELKTGSAAELFTLARKLDEIAAVRLGVISKSERGYLLLGAPQPSIKAGIVGLEPAVATARAFQQIAHQCLRHYRLNETLLLTAREAEALHQARVGIRRLRSALSIFKPVLKGPEHDRFRSEFRNLAAVLGNGRDIDVLLDRAKDGPLRDQLLVAREQAYADVETILTSESTRLLILDFAQWVSCGRWLENPALQDSDHALAASFAANALGGLRKKMKKRGKGLDHIADEERHEVRKLAKKLRYASEFFAGLFPRAKQASRHRKFVAALAKMQNKLGALNDLAATSQVLEKLDLVDHPEAGQLASHARKSKLLKSAASAFDDLSNAHKFWV